MGHFAKVINGIVVEVNSATQEWVDKQPKVLNIEWVQTSYNIRGGVYYDPNTNEPHPDQSIINEEPGRKRKNYAGLGYIYDKERDAFIPPTPYPSWILDEETCLWKAPKGRPEDYLINGYSKRYVWDEPKQEWIYTGYYITDNELLKDETFGQEE